MGSKRIYVRIKGGLGNQLFCYAFAKALSEKLNRKLILDTKTGFLKDSYGRLNKVNSFLRDYNSISYLRIINFYLVKKLNKISSIFFDSYYLEEGHTRQLINLDFLSFKVKKNIFCDGYFQSYKYLEKYESKLKKEINFKYQSSDKINVILEKIETSNSVAIHIRRIQYDSLLDLIYYKEAINYINNRTNKPSYFIFSDDLEWCKKNFDFLDTKYFIEHDSNDEIIDLHLMSLCKHFIIANSSFSWWGAWLSKNDYKIVIAPKNTDIGVIGDLYPLNWIQI